MNASRGGLWLDGLTVGYRVPRRRRARVVLAGLEAQARRGDLTVLLGPNGAGKSTLLRTVAGLQPALGGRALLDGADLGRLRPRDRARRLAVVLTDRVEAGLLTARELVALGRHPHTAVTGALTAADRSVVGWALDAVGGSHLAGRPVAELSDGERQRVMVARALAQEPAVLLLDEPTAFLDAPSRVTVTGLLRRLARERDLAVVASTHDLELALRVADHVWLLDRAGELRTGTPEELALSGTLAATFDTGEIAFDPAAGTFALRPPEHGTARVREGGPAGAVVARTLTRQGWHVVGDGGPADVEVAARDGGYVAWADARRWELGGIGALATWAREWHTERPERGWPLRRAAPDAVRSALEQAAAYGPFFTVHTARPDVEDGHPDGQPTTTLLGAPARAEPAADRAAEGQVEGDSQPVQPAGRPSGPAAAWRPLSTLADPDPDARELRGLVDAVAARLGVGRERRVAASMLFQGLAARLWSPLLACVAAGTALPDLDPDQVVWRDRTGVGSLELASAASTGWELAEDLPPEERLGATTALLVRLVVDTHLRPVVTALRAQVPVAEGLLWGNAASALVGSVQVLEHTATAGSEPGNAPAGAQPTKPPPVDGNRAWAVAARLLDTPPLREAGTLTGAREGGRLSFRRNSCCLYYRVPGGGMCGDCSLAGSGARGRTTRS